MRTTRLPVVDRTDTPSGRFKWTRPFRRKAKSSFCACAITFQLASTFQVILQTQRGLFANPQVEVLAQSPLFIRENTQVLTSKRNEQLIMSYC